MSVLLYIPSPSKCLSIFRFVRDGINCSISTDDPGFMLTTLISDYAVCADDFGINEDALKIMVSHNESHFLPILAAPI